MKVKSRGDKPPHLDMEQLPPEEVMAAWDLSNSLRRLVQHTNEFQAALQLFDFCSKSLEEAKNDLTKRDLPFTEWRLMAGRDGAMSLFHFGATIEGINASIGRYPVILSRVNQKALSESRKVLDQRFPMRNRIRHAIAHRADIFTDPARSRKHYTHTSAGLSEAYWNALKGRQFKHTINGKHCSYELSQATLDDLVEIRTKFFSAFDRPLRSDCH